MAALSDQAKGPRWWQAADGKWYPPDEPTLRQAVTETETIVSEAPQPVPPRGRWRTWHVVAASLLALLIGFGLGSADSSGSDDALAAAGGVTSTSTTFEATSTIAEPTTTTAEATTTTAAPPATTAPTTTTSGPPPTTATPRPPQRLAEWRGSGERSTTPFTIDPEVRTWTIEWEMTQGSTANVIELYVPPDAYEGLIASSDGPTASETAFSKPGTYYFKVAGGNWRIVVTQHF